MSRRAVFSFLLMVLPQLVFAGIVGRPLLNHKYFISLSVPQRNDYIKEVLQTVSDVKFSIKNLGVPVDGTVIPEDYNKFILQYSILEFKNCKSKSNPSENCERMASRIEQLTQSYQRFATQRRYIAEEDSSADSKPSRSIASVGRPAEAAPEAGVGANPAAAGNSKVCLEASETSNKCVPWSVTVRQQTGSDFRDCKILQPTNKHLVCDDFVLHTCTEKGELISGVDPIYFGRFLAQMTIGGALEKKENLGKDIIESVKVSSIQEIVKRVEQKHNVRVEVGTDTSRRANLERVAIVHNMYVEPDMCAKIAKLRDSMKESTPQQLCDNEKGAFKSTRLPGVAGAREIINSNYGNFGSVVSKCGDNQNPNLQAIQVARQGLEPVRMFPLSLKNTKGKLAELVFVDQGGQTQTMIIETSQDAGSRGEESVVNGQSSAKIIGVKTVAPCTVADASVVPATTKGSVGCGILVKAQCGGQATCTDATKAIDPKLHRK